jgi:cation:H+ antiporter
MILDILLLVAGLVLLVLGADWLVKGASSIAKKLRVSALVIGLTVVAFGTSMPELTVSTTAALNGSPDIALGNVVGSNIANILLILGVCALFRNLTVKSTTVWKEIPLAVVGMLLLFVFGNDHLFDNIATNALTRTDGIALLVLFGIFMYYIFGLAKSDRAMAKEAEESEIKVFATPLSAGYILAGLGLLVGGGRLLVDNAVDIASAAGLSEALIGLTVVAIGTSLPELATSLVATYRGQNDIAVGNIVGSNIFNIFWILGLSSIITPLPVSANASIDMLVGLGVTSLLFFVMFLGRKHMLTRAEGMLFVVAYIGYTGYLIQRG